MPRLPPDQSFYPSPSVAMTAEPEKLAYAAMLNPTHVSPGVARSTALTEGAETS
jgi:hypothetical protein